MNNKLIKNTILCISVILFLTAVGYTAYYATVRILQKTAMSETAEAVMADAAPQTSAPRSSPSPRDYYIARLKGSNIEISLVHENPGEQPKEKYLYSFEVYRNGIPENDISDLTRGIIFRTREELASFEEDFGS